jgi:hypothetical protein
MSVQLKPETFYDWSKKILVRYSIAAAGLLVLSICFKWEIWLVVSLPTIALVCGGIHCQPKHFDAR